MTVWDLRRSTQSSLAIKSYVIRFRSVAGRNLAVICEAAAVNHRQKKMGYNAAQELYRRVQENLTKKSDDEEDE